MRVGRGPTSRTLLAAAAILLSAPWPSRASASDSVPGDVELAAQVGAGFELRVARGAILALEFDGTGLYPTSREPPSVAASRLWGTLLAARAVF